MPDLFANISPARLLPEGLYGVEGTAGVAAREVGGLAAATLVARAGKTAALVSACTAAGLPLVDAPRMGMGAGLEAIGTAPGRWLVLAEGTGGRALRHRLEAIGPGLAAVTDQSDANLILDIQGPRARDALMKGVTLDLDPAAFAPGDVATTIVAHVGVTFWRREGETFRFVVGNSYAPAFLRFMAASAAEYGFALAATGRG